MKSMVCQVYGFNKSQVCQLFISAIEKNEWENNIGQIMDYVKLMICIVWDQTARHYTGLHVLSLYERRSNVIDLLHCHWRHQ